MPHIYSIVECLKLVTRDDEHTSFSRNHTQFAKANYSLDEAQTCEFIPRGFNDHYQLIAGNTRYVFRVYLNDKYYVDSPQAFQFELNLVDYLYKQGISVAHAFPWSDNELLGCIDTNLVKRCTALFSYASGESLLEKHLL